MLSPRGRPWPPEHILKSLTLKVKSLASKPIRLRKCPVLEDSTFFDWLKMDHGHDLLSTLPWKMAETSQKNCRRPFGEHLIFHGKSVSPRVKIFFLGEHLSLVSLASKGFVLEKSVLGLGFFLCPWPRRLCPRLHL